MFYLLLISNRPFFLPSLIHSRPPSTRDIVEDDFECTPPQYKKNPLEYEFACLCPVPRVGQGIHLYCCSWKEEKRRKKGKERNYNMEQYREPDSAFPFLIHPAMANGDAADNDDDDVDDIHCNKRLRNLNLWMLCSAPPLLLLALVAIFSLKL